MPAPIDLTGQKFGLLTAQKPTHSLGVRVWFCRCACGGTAEVPTGALRSGNTRSCGCRKRAVLGESTTTHGGCGTRTYRIWKAMRTRCNNPNFHAFPRYGGRGITVCERWGSFSAFRADMGEAPVGMSIERENTNGNYEPGNCRWATPKEQARNMRVNRMVTHEGETLCLAAWAERLGTTSDVLWKRLRRKGSIL